MNYVTQPQESHYYTLDSRGLCYKRYTKEMNTNNAQLVHVLQEEQNKLGKLRAAAGQGDMFGIPDKE
jgi:hypothetical protein